MIDEYQRELRFLHAGVLISLFCFEGILLSGGVACVWAESSGSGTALIPGYTGTNYSFFGNYAAGQIIINSSGTYYLTESLNASSSDFGILIQGEGITLDGNLKNLSGTSNYGINVTSTGNDTTIKNFGNISGFIRGIYAEGDRLQLIKNCISGNQGYALLSRGSYLNASDNIVFGNYNGLYATWGDGKYPFITNNTAFGNSNNGIYSGQDYARIFRNTAYGNGKYGIYTAGVNCGGTDPGTCGSGYYANISGNTVHDNEVGIHMVEPSSYARDNAIYDNQRGIRLGSSMNVSVFNNTIRNSTQGIYLPDGRNLQVTLFQNRIINSSDSGIYFADSYSDYRRGNGTIFDNYLENRENVKANRSLSNFTWTHPTGPVAGTNVMGGPYVAGNYWTCPSRLGWSDLQDPAVTGYATNSYEVVSGSQGWDTAPLVRVAKIINSSHDDWTIIDPTGNLTYPAGANQTYVTQAKPGADLVNISVNGTMVGPVSSWTFTNITTNHTLSTIGKPTPGQVHAFFTLNTTWGALPLTVSFTNQSLGSPTSFSWNFGDGGRSTDQDPIHTFTFPGTFSVTLKAMNDQTGGIATLHNAVTVTDGVIPSPTPTPVPGTITASFLADQTSGFVPMQVTFTDSSSGNPTSWFWDLGDGNTSTMQNVTHIYTTKGAYSVRLLAQNSLSSGNMEKSGYIIVT